MKRKWCEHLFLIGKEYLVSFSYKNEMGGMNIDTKGWKFCPICGKPRPVERKEK